MNESVGVLFPLMPGARPVPIKNANRTEVSSDRLLAFFLGTKRLGTVLKLKDSYFIY